MRPLGETFERSFHNVIANWPLLLIQIAAGVAMIVFAILTFVIVFLPFPIAAAIRSFDLEHPERIAEAIVKNPMVIVMAIVALGVVITIALAIHCFVHGGALACYAEGERAAGAAAPRSAFRRFSPDLFIAGGRRFWWPFFIVYNITWGAFGLILLGPLALIAAILWSSRGRQEAILVSCLLLLAFLIVLIVLSLVVYLWTQLALTSVVARGGNGMRAIRDATGVFRRHWLPILIATVLMFVLSSMVGMMGGFYSGAMGGASESLSILTIVTAPMQIFASLVQTVVSLALSSWLSATLISIAIEDARRDKRAGL